MKWDYDSLVLMVSQYTNFGIFAGARFSLLSTTMLPVLVEIPVALFMIQRVFFKPPQPRVSMPSGELKEVIVPRK